MSNGRDMQDRFDRLLIFIFLHIVQLELELVKSYILSGSVFPPLFNIYVHMLKALTIFPSPFNPIVKQSALVVGSSS